MPAPMNKAPRSSRTPPVYPRYTLITHVKYIDPITRTAEDLDILIMREHPKDAGKIVAMDSDLKPTVSPLTRVRGSGLYACRGFVDLHAHIGEPFDMSKEDIATATAAAAAGGYSDILALPTTPSTWTDVETLDYLHSNAAAKGKIALHPATYLTVGNRGESLVDLEGLLARNSAFFDEGAASPALLYEAMARLAPSDALLIYRPDIPAISQTGDRKAAVAAASMALSSALSAAALTGCRLHITCISSQAEVELIRDARRRGVRITCDTAPQYFTLTSIDLFLHGNLAKVTPPLQSSADREAIVEALADGTIDCIVTDHTPELNKAPKTPLAQAASGMLGLQTAFALGMRELVQPGRIDFYRLIELLSIAPARILGIPDRLAPESPASVTLIDVNREYTLTEEMLCSKSKNCPWIKQSFQGVIKRNFAKISEK